MKQDIYVLIEHLGGQVAYISYTMLAAARSIVAETGGSVVAVLLDHSCEAMVNELAADRLLCFENPLLADFAPEAYQHILAGLIHQEQPRVFLFGDTSIYAEIAARLSVQLDLSLVSSCQKLEFQDGKLFYNSLSYGGKVLVEGEVPEPTSLITMLPGDYEANAGKSSTPLVVVWANSFTVEPQAVRFQRYIEPDTSDIDITKQPIMISVGGGVQNPGHLYLIQELAEAMGGVITSSRPMVDRGCIPASRLVGKSGKRVKPKVYLALGISGAPEHMEAITESDVILAVNTDPNAPIFQVARYGAVVDLLELVPILTENIRQLRQPKESLRM